MENPKTTFQEGSVRKGVEDNTYLSATEGCFWSRGFPIEIISPVDI